jgi:acetyltransferase-like isoleucine patch superfamily enzyme
LRFDGKPVTIRYENGYPTNERKIGAFIGDGTQVGCNAVLNPGTVLGKNSLVAPLALCSGVYGTGSICKASKLMG